MSQNEDSTSTDDGERTCAPPPARDRNYTPEEQLKMMRDVRDNALDTLSTLASKSLAKGAAGAMRMFEQACANVAIMENETAGAGADLSIPGVDRSKFVFSPDTVTVQKEEVTA